MGLWTIFFFVIGICILSFPDKSLSQKVRFPEFEGINKFEKVAPGSIENIGQSDDSLRNQRSPFHNDAEDDYFGDYSDGPDVRHLNHGHNKKKLHKPFLLELLGGQGGCRGHGCSGSQGWQPQSGHNHGSHGNQGGSFASASAGSVGGSPHQGGSQSQANAQSASFSFGPYSATFSVAQASAGNNKNDGIRDYYDY